MQAPGGIHGYLRSAFTPILKDCKAKAAQLKELFEKAMPHGGDSRWDRYVKAARRIRKGGRVETLIRGIVETASYFRLSIPSTPASTTSQFVLLLEHAYV